MTAPLATLILAGYNARPAQDGTATEAIIEKKNAFDRVQEWLFSHVFYNGGEFIHGYKAVKPINGIPMVQYVIDAAKDFMSSQGQVYVIGDEAKLAKAGVTDCCTIPQGFTFGENLFYGLHHIGEQNKDEDLKVIVLTCDIPKITKRTVEDVLKNYPSDADFGISVMRKQVFKQADDYVFRLRKPKYFLLFEEGKYRIVNAGVVNLNNKVRNVVNDQFKYIDYRKRNIDLIEGIISSLKTFGIGSSMHVDRIDSIYANRRPFWFPNARRVSAIAGQTESGGSYLAQLILSQIGLAPPLSLKEIERLISRLSGLEGRMIQVTQSAAEQDADWKGEFAKLKEEIEARHRRRK